MIEERSAGAVLFNDEDGSICFLLLNYPTGHWDFPKGNIEKDEEPIDTVRREISEETGIADIKILPGFSKRIEYYYRRKAGLVHKQVIYLLARTKTKNVTLSHEHKNYSWLELEKAVDTVTYRNSKNILQAAFRFLDDASTHPDESAP